MGVSLHAYPGVPHELSTDPGLVAVGAASYADDSDALGGVAPSVPFLYFAAGAVVSRLWAGSCAGDWCRRQRTAAYKR
jgi:hypothetical protein